jgi:putative membrane protein
MRKAFLKLIFIAVLCLGVAYIIPGLLIKNFWAALVFSLILGFMNVFVRPILTLLTLPISVLTLGIFTLIINAFVFWLASLISFGVIVESFAAAFWGGAIVWLGSTMIAHWIERNPNLD